MKWIGLGADRGRDFIRNGHLSHFELGHGSPEVAYRWDMTNDLQVIVDGEAEYPAPSSGQTSSWVLVAVGFIVGLGLGVLVVSPQQEVEPTPVDDVATPVVETVPQVTDAGLGDLVDEFSDSLVALTAPDVGGFNRLLWTSDSALSVAIAGNGSGASLDISGQVLATTESVPGLDGVVLSLGRLNRARPLTSGVTSYQWHDSKAGLLSYTTEVDGEWQLWTVFGDLRPDVVTSEAHLAGGRIAAWGDWGWAIATDEGLVLLNPSGHIKTSLENGVAVASDGAGWLLVADERLQLVSAGGGVKNISIPPNRVGELRTASFSPTRDMLAVAGDRGVLVFPVDGGGEITEVALSGAVHIAWSSDSRYVVASAARGVSIVDLQTVTRVNILPTHTIISLRLVGSPS